jgi:hypothetical protein
MRTQAPFLSLFLTKQRLGSVALLPKSPARRVWLPSRRSKQLEPLKASFSPQRSWALPFRALFLSRDRVTLSDQSFRSCAFLQNLPALYRRFNGFIPREKRFPYLLARDILPGQDSLLSWASGLSGSPSGRSMSRASPSRHAPRVLRWRLPHGTHPHEPQGVGTFRLGVFPYGMPARLAFRPTAFAIS